MNNYAEKLAAAVELSNRIVQVAEEKDWHQLGRLDQQRKGLLEDVFSDASRLKADSELKRAVQKIIQLNEQALHLCAESRESLSADGHKIKRGREAVAAYQQQQPQYLA